MPDYPVPDPKTGRMVIITSESLTPPTPEDVEEILEQLRARDMQAEPYTDPMVEPTDPGHGVTGIAPEGVETWAAGQGVGLAGKGMERGAPYLTGPLGAGLGGKVGASLGAPFIGATLGAKLGHVAQPAVRAVGRGLQFAPRAAPWVAGAQLADEFNEEDGVDPLDVASLLGLGMTAFPPTAPLGLTLMTGTGLLGGAGKIYQGQTGAGLLEAGLSALPWAGKLYKGARALLPKGAAAATSTAPEALGASAGRDISEAVTPNIVIPAQRGAAGVARRTPPASTQGQLELPLPAGVPSIRTAPGGAAEALAGGPTSSRAAKMAEAESGTDVLEELEQLTGGAGMRSVPGRGTMPAKPPNDVVDMIRALEPDFLTQDVVRFPRPAAGTGLLRTDESVLGLARELAEKWGVPAPTKLRSYPRPTGNTELERALRQRAHVAGSKKPTTRREPAKKEKK